MMQVAETRSYPNAFFNRQSPTVSPLRYRLSNSSDRSANIRRTSCLLPLILAIFMES